MALLRSFSWGSYKGVSELPKDVLGLFVCLVENPEKKVEFTSTIINNSLDGKIDLTRDFNLDGYEAAIRKNQYLSKQGEKKKKSYIDFSNDKDNFVDVARSGGITADMLYSNASAEMQESYSCADEMIDAFETVLDSEELKYAVSTIKSLNYDFIKEYGTDLVHCLKQALRGIPQAIEEAKRVCDDFPVIADLVKTILTSNEDINVLFAC